MDATNFQGVYSTTSRRAANTYRGMLSEFTPLPGSLSIEAQRDLHDFFTALYNELCAAPETFGLPTAADVYLIEDHAKEGPNKTAVKNVLDKQHKLIDGGLSFLAAAGREGRLVGDELFLAAGVGAADFLKKKPGKSWISGMERAGLALIAVDGGVCLQNARFPRMMAALQALAHACASCADTALGQLFFARCDLRALAGDFTVQPLDLYRIFPAEDTAWAADLHEYFTTRGYQAQVEFGRIYAWTVKYQGKRAVKATPLFQVDFDERYLHQMRAQIKCASVQRIVGRVAQQSAALQADFAGRVFNCGDCSWCDTRPHLGPSEFSYAGETRKICWYIPGDLKQITPETRELVKEYAVMHETLA